MEMYLVLFKEEEFEKVPRWIVHPNKEAKGGLWSEPGVEAEAKSLIKRDYEVKNYQPGIRR